MAYGTILTAIGKAKLANATALGQTLSLTEISVGDGNGSAIIPEESNTALINEVWRADLNNISIDENNASWVVCEGYIPSTDGNFTIREVGLFDDVGDMIAVSSYPETYKPTLAEGAAKDLYLKITMEVTNADTVELKIDPAVVLASREYVVNELSIHDQDVGSHPDLILKILKAMPAGMPISWPGDTAPEGYLVRDGSELDKIEYAQLYAVIGDLWATTGGASSPAAGNFRLPPQKIDGLGLYERGLGDSTVVGEYQVDVFKEHNHGIGSPDGIGASSSGGSGDFAQGDISIYSEIKGNPIETRPRSITMLMCIKY